MRQLERNLSTQIKVSESQYNTISLSRHEKVCLRRLRFERYFSHHRASMMGQVSLETHLLKHTCSWRVNLLYYEYWTDKRQCFYVLTSHSTLYYVCSANLSKSFSQLIVSVFTFLNKQFLPIIIFSQYFFQ